jgi:hypothetical protein
MDKYKLKISKTSNAVITATNDNYFRMFVSWYASLREISKYTGQVHVINCGLTVAQQKAITDQKITIHNQEIKEFYVGRDFALYDILHLFDKFIFVDCDCWFQDTIEDAFNKNHLCFTYDIPNYKQKNMFKESDPDYGIAQDKLSMIYEKYGGTINIGVRAGPSLLFKKRFTTFRQLFNDKRLEMKFGSGQFASNWLLSEFDEVLPKIWNDNRGINGYTEQGNFITINDIKSKIIHLAGLSGRNKNEKTMNPAFFEIRYRDLFLEYSRKLNLNG